MVWSQDNEAYNIRRLVFRPHPLGGGDENANFLKNTPEKVSFARGASALKILCQYKGGDLHSYLFDEMAFIRILYVDEALYSRFGPQFCLMFDVGLNKGGSEAIVESLYSVMKSQAMPGGQSNRTLVSRTKVDWTYPKTSLGIPSLIDSATSILRGGTKRDPFTMTRGPMSKVVERISSDTGRVPIIKFD